MTKSGRKGSSRFVWRCVLAAVVVIAYAGACALVSRTLTEWWIPFAFSIALAFLAGVFLWKIWRWFTGSGRFIWNFLVGAVALTGIFSSAFYIVNYACADRATAHEERAEVARVYYKVRHHPSRGSQPLCAGRGLQCPLHGGEDVEWYVERAGNSLRPLPAHQERGEGDIACGYGCAGSAGDSLLTGDSLFIRG